MATPSEHSSQQLKTTPLHDLHVELGGKMVPFAGYDMPVQFPLGILKEHLFTRQSAGLFDVSHMGQAFLTGPDHASVAAALEALTPGDFQNLGLGRVRYTLLMNDDGGIIDDLMVTRSVSDEDDGRLYLVVNAARKDVDLPHIQARLPQGMSIELDDTRALLALQGPKAAEVLARHCSQSAEMGFMTARNMTVGGIDCHVSRSGYSGEDGYEISVAGDRAEELARLLLAESEVEAIGLGARDSLRLEVGLCLYGHDIDEQTSPVEAGLEFALSKRRREEGGFPGADRVRDELANGTSRRRVGVLPEGRAPAREGTVIVDGGGRPIGAVTSGGFGPSAGGPVAMGYVEAAFAEPGSDIFLEIRGKAQPAKVAALPFVPQRYYRKPKV